MPDGQWCLSVINERGVMATWLECFESAEMAMEVARKAIEGFVSIEGFEYLDDEWPCVR
jgi:tRNA A58 N-methylase Trm61